MEDHDRCQRVGYWHRKLHLMLFPGRLAPNIAALMPASGVSYEAEASAYFAAMTSQPDDTRKGLINTLVAGLKADGVWPRLDWLCLFASHDAQSSCVNLINPAKSAAPTNSPAFTADRGFSGDGSTSYVIFSEVMNAVGNLAVLDDASFFSYCNLQGAGVAGSGYHFSQATSSFRAAITATSSGNDNFRVNDTTSSTLRASTSRTGFRAGSRNSSSSKKGYYNGTLVADLTLTSTNMAGLAAQILRSGTNSYSQDRIAASGWGASLSDTQMAALHTRLHTYLTSIGANY